MTDLLKRKDMVRTDMYCHHCDKNFIAKLDHSLDGNHQICCPHCNHTHFRLIKDGVVTGDRWDSEYVTHVVPKRSTWTHDSQPIITNSAAAFIRNAWLERLTK